MTAEIKNKLRCGLALTVNESWDLYKYIEALEQTELNLSYNGVKSELDYVSREDAINVAIDAVDEWDGGCNTSRATMISNAIKMLPPVTPQEPILDKIRAEIEEYKSRQLTLAIGVKDLEKGKQIALECVLAILDKYRVESEDKK